MKFRSLCLSAIFIALLAGAPLAWAQVVPKSSSFTAYALDAKTLASGNMVISLWGVDPPAAAGDIQNIIARAELDDFIGTNPVRCTPMRTLNAGNVIAQCLNVQEQDIALSLISRGLLPTNRRDLIGNNLANAYLDAERKARASKLGIWAGNALTPVQTETTLSALDRIPLWVFAAAFVTVSLLGSLIIGLVMRSGFKQLIHLQKYQLAGTQKREKLLKAREKYVIAAALEGEINTNRAKLDAFLVIYEELLKSLRDPSKTPKYQRVGDIIHERPALARTVFDAHVDKLDILGLQVKNDLVALYDNISATPDYRTLEPEVPIEKARETVDRILRQAIKLSDPMDKALATLGVVVRDKRSSISSE